jgi:hypothetical protein
MTVPPIIGAAEFEAVQAHLKARSPAWTTLSRSSCDGLSFELVSERRV